MDIFANADAVSGKYGKIYTQAEDANQAQFHMDEPVFIIRAQDLTAVPTLQAYMVLCEEPGNDPSHLEGIRQELKRFETWQMENRALVKRPD